VPDGAVISDIQVVVRLKLGSGLIK
jgi:hypothetical protein